MGLNMKEQECKTNSNFGFFEDELKNFQENANYIKPASGDMPSLNGIDIYGETIPLNGVIGGDHIIYVDFNRRYDLESRIREAQESHQKKIIENLEKNKTRAGVLIADVSGHKITDYLLAAMLHQAFLMGVLYELKQNGQVTTDLFENINTRFYNSSSLSKYITMIYGEISESGMFQFINAGHPNPVIFSQKYDKLFKVSYHKVVHFPPIGTLPSEEDIDYRKNWSRLGYKKKYSLHEITLMGSGDILLLYTDGLLEHTKDMNNFYFSDNLEKILQKVKNKEAEEIFCRIKKDMLGYCKARDDISMVVIKKL